MDPVNLDFVESVSMAHEHHVVVPAHRSEPPQSHAMLSSSLQPPTLSPAPFLLEHSYSNEEPPTSKKSSHVFQLIHSSPIHHKDGDSMLTFINTELLNRTITASEAHGTSPPLPSSFLVQNQHLDFLPSNQASPATLLVPVGPQSSLSSTTLKSNSKNKPKTSVQNSSISPSVSNAPNEVIPTPRPEVNTIEEHQLCQLTERHRCHVFQTRRRSFIPPYLLDFTCLALRSWWNKDYFVLPIDPVCEDIYVVQGFLVCKDNPDEVYIMINELELEAAKSTRVEWGLSCLNSTAVPQPFRTNFAGVLP